ncbi:MAG: prolyl oligopeptidase family serine peptidase [Rhodospirillaceae bacterium]
MYVDGHAHAPEEIVFTCGGNTLTGYLYIPDGDGPFPCIVDNHGSQLPQDSADLSHPQTAAVFDSLGCAYFFPHRSGYGRSQGTPLSQEVPAARGTALHDHQMSERLKRENLEVISTLDRLEQISQIDPHRIGVMGSSLGGIHTLLALSRDSRWKCGIDFSGGASQWDDHPIIREMLKEAVRTLTQPIFLIQPANDFNTAPTIELSKILVELGKTHDAAIFPAWGVAGGEAHRFCAAGHQIWGPVVKNFLKKHLLQSQ